MSRTAHCRLQAHMADLQEAVAFAEAFCAAGKVADADRLRLALMVEELFTNTVSHGHGADSTAPVALRLQDDGTHIELFYEDSAPAFDPLAHAAGQPVVDTDDPATVPGGWGIALVAHLSATARYAREGGHNRLWLQLKREG